MKINELEGIIKCLSDLDKYSSKLDYNTSSTINRYLVQVLPLLKAEEDRMTCDKIEINCPQIEMITSEDALRLDKTIQEYINTRIKELVSANYKILDFNILNIYYPEKAYGYIKYTS